MNFTQLKYFLEVAKTGSFTKAADNLFITQPSLSVGIRKLEENLEVKLFNRGKELLLTNSGKYLLAQAKKILAEIELVERKLRQTHSNEKTIRIGILHSLPIASIAKLINDFSKIHPDIIIEQISGSMMELEEWLEKKYLDLAFKIPKKQKASNICEILFSQNYRLTISATHHLAQKKTLLLSDLDGLPYIDRVQCEIRDDLQSLFAEKKVLPKVVCRTANDELSNHLVILGKGVAVMPVQKNRSNVLHLPFSDINLTRQVCLETKFETNSEIINLFHKFTSDYTLQELHHSCLQ